MIFDVFERFATETFGPVVYDEILDQCPIAGLQPDDQVSEILAVACWRLGVAPEVLLRSFGRFAARELVMHRAGLHAGGDPLQFLGRLGELVRAEGANLVTEAHLPAVHSETVGDGVLRMELRAPQGWCSVLEGMLDGVAEASWVCLHHRHAVCARDGAASCVFEVVI